MGQRVLLGVSLTEIAWSIDAHGRKGSRGSRCGCDYGGLCCRSKGKLANDCVWVGQLGMNGLGRVRAMAVAPGSGGHAALAGGKSSREWKLSGGQDVTVQSADVGTIGVDGGGSGP